MSQGSPWGPQGLLLWEAVIDWWVLSMVSVNCTCYAHTSPSSSGRGVGAEDIALVSGHCPLGITCHLLHSAFAVSLNVAPSVSGSDLEAGSLQRGVQALPELLAAPPPQPTSCSMAWP